VTRLAGGPVGAWNTTKLAGLTRENWQGVFEAALPYALPTTHHDSCGRRVDRPDPEVVLQALRL